MASAKDLALTKSPTLARRTLIRAYESLIVAKAQEEHRQEGDRQAPMTLLRRPDGTPQKIVMATTDEQFAEDVLDAVNSGVAISVQLHHAPTENELDDLAKELPMPHVPPALPPPPSSGVQNVGGPFRSQAKLAPGATPSSVPTYDASGDDEDGFVVRIFERSKEVDTLGPFDGIREAVSELKSTDAAPGATAKITREGRVVRYCDRPARYVHPRSAWSQV